MMIDTADLARNLLFFSRLDRTTRTRRKEGRKKEKNGREIRCSSRQILVRILGLQYVAA